MVIEKHIVKDSSDHLPLLFCLHVVKVCRQGKIFRFDHMWLTHNSCKDVTKE